MTAWDFANGNPLVALTMVFLVVMLVRSICYRIARTLCIRKQGWPPAHLDADGEPIKSEERSETCRNPSL